MEAIELFSLEEKRIIIDAKAQIIDSVRAFRNAYVETGIIPLTAMGSMFLSGGAIASLIQGNQPNDWDFYFTNKEVMEHVQKVILDNPECIEEYDEGYHAGISGGKHITTNAITLKGKWSIITGFYGEIKDITKSFDYVHCTPHYSFIKKKLLISRSQYNCIINKKLIVNNKNNIKEWRREKFISRGYIE